MYVKGLFEVFKILGRLGIKPKDVIGMGGDIVKMGKSLFNTRINPKLITFIEKNQKIPTKILDDIKLHARTLKNATENQKNLFLENIKSIQKAKTPPKIQTTRGMGDLWPRQIKKVVEKVEKEFALKRFIDAAQKSKPPVTGVKQPATSVREQAAEAFKGWKPTVIKGGKDGLATGGIANHFRIKKSAGGIGDRVGFAKKGFVQPRASGGSYTKMYSMEEIRKLGKELNVSEYNKKTDIKLTSKEYRARVINSKARFNFYKNQFDSFSPKKKKAYMIDFNKQFVKQSDGIYHISTDKRLPNAKFVKKYFPNATGGSKIVTSINGMLTTEFEKKGNIITNSPKADANAIRIKDLKKITDPTWETSTGVQGTKGSTLQHVASKNQMVKLNNLSYLEKTLNSSMSQNDKRIKIIENEVDRLLKTKPKNYVQRINALNTEGMALASGYIKKDGKIVKGSTAGHSEFRVKDPLNGKLSYFGKDESKMLLPDKDPHLIQKDSDLIGKNIKEMTIDEKKRAGQIASGKNIDKQKYIEFLKKKSKKAGLFGKLAKGVGKLGLRTVGAAIPFIGPAMVGWGTYDVLKAQEMGLTNEELAIAYGAGPEIAEMWSDLKPKMKENIQGMTLKGNISEGDTRGYDKLSGVDKYILDRYK